MKFAKDLDKNELIDIVNTVQDLLFFDITSPKNGKKSKEIWNPNKDVDGADFVESMIDVLNYYGLVPKRVQKVD